MSFILGLLLGRLFSTFLVFVFINFLSKKKLSLNIRALLTFFIVMTIDYFSGNGLVILVVNGISIIVAYYYFKRTETKKLVNEHENTANQEQYSEFAKKERKEADE